MSSELPIIHEHSADIPLVEIRHILRSGAAMEPAEQAGVGRLALRLLRRGAAGKDRRAVDEALDRIAAVLSTQATPDFFAIHFRVLRKYLDKATALFAEVRRRFLPNAVVLLRTSENAERLAALAPWTAGQGPLDGKATAYACRAGACERPVTEPAALAAALDADPSPAS